MTVKQFIENNQPFYHITKANLRNEILKNGLTLMGRQQRQAICVVRTNDEIIINFIATSQLGINRGEEAIIITLFPIKHGIVDHDVSEDSIDEPTATLHNYIHKTTIVIDESDIASFIVKDFDLDYEDLNRLITKLKLTDYTRKPFPPLPVNLDDY